MDPFSPPSLTAERAEYRGLKFAHDLYPTRRPKSTSSHQLRLQLRNLGPGRESERELPGNLGIGPGFPAATAVRIPSLVARAGYAECYTTPENYWLDRPQVALPWVGGLKKLPKPETRPPAVRRILAILKEPAIFDGELALRPEMRVVACAVAWTFKVERELGRRAALPEPKKRVPQ